MLKSITKYNKDVAHSGRVQEKNNSIIQQKNLGQEYFFKKRPAPTAQ